MPLFGTFYSSKNPEKNHKILGMHNFIIIIINVSWALIQHIKMISEGSRDTEDWNDGCFRV